MITLDVMMPGMDGWAVLAALKTDAATHDIPVVMLTIVDDRGRGFHLGASEYITKPIDWERLRGIVKKYTQQTGKVHILVVDDDPANRELMSRVLRREGWSVMEAENGKIALLRLAEQKPALILLDLMMPEMDGFAFLEELHRRPDVSHLPVVVVTAKELTPDDRRRLNGSVEQILHKDAEAETDILEWLQGWLRENLPGSAPPAPQPAQPEAHHAEAPHR